jgi:hypothetical protein
MKPTVRIIQDQSVESTREITGSEAEEILRRYGHAPQQFSTRQEEPQQPVDNGLTFEQMVAQQEAKKRGEEMRRQQKLNGPKPITFQGTQYDTEVKYGSDDELGFGFKIEITTDMKLPKNY